MRTFKSDFTGKVLKTGADVSAPGGPNPIYGSSEVNMESLLLEIGTEEIPAGYIEPALDALSRTLREKLTRARIDHGVATVYGTPRRLAVIVDHVASRQHPLKTEVQGPPERIAFDAQGNATVAAIKFAEKIGIDAGRLVVKSTEKGSYVCAVKTERGRSTDALLKQIIPEVITALPFPKTMTWGARRLHFARPIHFILCLRGSRVVSFALDGLKSGRYTRGHSFVCPGKIRIPAAEQYPEILRRAHVVADLSERRRQIEADIASAATTVGGSVLPDPELVDTVKNLVEFPAVVAGGFDPKFLRLPREILITAMREHQKYFAIVDESDHLMPGFIAVNNTPARDMDLVARGHERVLRARLEDAQFFFNSDLKVPLDRWVEKLKGVLFQASLGSVYEKTLRVRQLAEFIADAVSIQNGSSAQAGDLKATVSRAAFLCKADLVSQVVGEFPKLQGIMGRVYAMRAGESDAVAAAIESHYRPVYSGGPLPDSPAGALLSVADKIDSICGCFQADLIPTGASDPYALRRQGIGIVQIMLANGLSFSLRQVIRKGVALFGEADSEKRRQTENGVYTFISHRIVNLLTEEGFSRDLISAIVAVSIDHVPNVWNRIRALQSLKEKPDFEPLAVAFKRVVNIIRQAGEKGILARAREVDPRLFQDEAERSLYRACGQTEQAVAGALKQGQVESAMLKVAALRPAVDAFFDKVLVMAEDPDVRCNRLAVLAGIAALFAEFADFSKIST